MSNFHFKRASARSLALSTASLACLTTTALAQEAANPSQASPDLPPVEVPQSQPAQAKPKPAAKKPKTQATAKPKQTPAAAAPEPEPVAAPAPEPADPAVALGSYNPALATGDLVLPPGTTLTTAGPVDGYRALTAMSSTKTATPIEQIPQSIQIVPRTIIEDQANRSVTETLRNVSNVQGLNDLSIANIEQQQLKVRGFDAEQWLDGLVVNYTTGDRNSFSNVERVEVLKGPSAILYGGGSGAPVGGAVNVISKLPTHQTFGAVGFTFGGHNYLQPYFDINQPISTDGTVLFRVTGEYTAADSFIDVLEQDRYSINPTLTFTNKTDTTVTVQGHKSRSEQQAYQGLPAVGTVAGDFRIDPYLYIGPSDIPRSYTDAEGVTITVDHRFNPIWSFNVKGRWMQTAFDQNSQATFSGAPFVGSEWELVASDIKADQEEFSINPNLQARFAAGPTRNTVLFGADYSRVTDSGYHHSDTFGNLFYLFGLAPPATTVDLLNPSFPIPYVDPTPTNSAEFASFGDYDNLYVTKGAYTQIQTSLYDRVHLMAGLRLANIDVDYFDPTNFVDAKTNTTKLLPRVGAVIDVFDGLSVYASYSQGMRWTGFTPTLDRPLEPEDSEQREIGLKFNLASNLSGTVALFDIDKTNVPVPVGPGNTLFASQQSRGFEADLLWQPSENWRIIASYGYVDAEYSDSLVRPEGNKLAAVPQHSGRFWVNYAFDEAMLRGWSVGAGVYASSGAHVDSLNVFKTESYFTVDAKIGYENEQFAATFNVKNLTDEFYFEPYPWFEGQVAPGADRQFFGTVVYKY